MSPEVPQPDDKDWTFVLERPCPECGFVAAEVEITELPALVEAAAAPWGEVLARPDAAVRPAPRVWSPLEYGCHVRDVLVLFAERAELMQREDDPLFGNWDQDATALEQRYWEQEPGVVASEITDAARGNAAVWARVSDWSRQGRRSNGSDPAGTPAAPTRSTRASTWSTTNAPTSWWSSARTTSIVWTRAR